ncbi:MAG: sulfatase-like hydrolase/transferase [Kiritimatiellae bacterium]|nr:sulfatase-like hydrolase/transferase [Kiritimatiellia bacterium]
MTTPDKPNILFIITDHHAYAYHQRPGEFTFDLPVWRQFCADGVRFDRAYSVCPLCTPARATMMSGVYPSAHGLLFNTDGGGRQRDFRPDQPLYNPYLEQAGYRNAYVGKWHCGHRKLPQDYGLPGWSTPDYGNTYLTDRYGDYAKARGLGDARAFIEHWLGHADEAGREHVLHHGSPWRFMNASGVQTGPPDAHHDFFVSNLSCAALRDLAKGSSPWSLVASFWGPHQPYYPTEPYAGMIDPKTIPECPTFRDDLAGRPSRHLLHRDVIHGNAVGQWPQWSTWQKVLARNYEQQILLDAAIGRLLDTLEATGQADNTLVIWVADHGDALASHGGTWDKSPAYTEEVGRVPFAIRWPAALRGGVCTPNLVSNMDVTATMIDAAGVAVPDHMHSRSLLPLCRDPAGAEWPDEVVCEHHGHQYQLLERIVVTDRFKYVTALFDGDELYDLQADPYETRNLASDPDYAEVGRELRERLIRHIESTRDRVAARHLPYWLREGLGVRGAAEATSVGAVS